MIILCRKINGYVVTMSVAKDERHRREVSIFLPHENKRLLLYLNTFLSFSVSHFDYSYVNKDNIVCNKTLDLDNTYPSVLYQTDVVINNNITIDKLSLFFIQNNI